MLGNDMKFKRLEIKNWRQFQNVEIDFSSNVTILTGANGAGKSTILKILSQHFGWGNALLGTPSKSEGGVFEYLHGIFLGKEEPATQSQIGSITYGSMQKATLFIPISGGASFHVSIAAQQPVLGLFIPSHRPVMNYQPVSSIPTTSVSAEQAYQAYFQETTHRYNNQYSNSSPTYRMKEAIISMATFGPGNKNVTGNPESEKVFVDFESTLAVVLPPDLGFERLSVRIPDVVLVTRSGEFVLDAASGGIMSLIDLTWQIFLYSIGKSEFVVILDEPENHLHPSMQRSLLQNLVMAFPQAQFIIATHSPFVVSSVKDAPVFVLSYGANPAVSAGPGKLVYSVLLDSFSKAGTASEILRSALGVPVTMPIWAEAELRSIASDYSMSDLTNDSLNNLKMRLAQAGLADFYPDALRQMAARA
jgi:hypothetical protein